MVLAESMYIFSLICLLMHGSVQASSSHEIIRHKKHLVPYSLPWKTAAHKSFTALAKFLLASNFASPISHHTIIDSHLVRRDWRQCSGPLNRTPTIMSDGGDDAARVMRQLEHDLRSVSDELVAAKAISEDLQVELDALRTLYDEDVGSLQARLNELEQDGKKYESGSINFDHVDDAAEPARIESLNRRVMELTGELSAARDRALCAEAENIDLRKEVDAMRVLAEEDEQLRRAENNRLLDELHHARNVAGSASNDEVEKKLREELKAVRTLYDQDNARVEQLLSVIQKEAAATATMAARAEALEKKLMDIKSTSNDT